MSEYTPPVNFDSPDAIEAAKADAPERLPDEFIDFYKQYCHQESPAINYTELVDGATVEYANIVARGLIGEVPQQRMLLLRSTDMSDLEQSDHFLVVYNPQDEPEKQLRRYEVSQVVYDPGTVHPHTDRKMTLQTKDSENSRFPKLVLTSTGAVWVEGGAHYYLDDKPIL